VNRSTELHRFDWNGMLLEIAYEPVWMPAHIAGEDIAHLKVRSVYPTDVPLPFAKHGCFSSTILASTVAAAGGPVNYVDVMLTVESDTPAWREQHSGKMNGSRTFPWNATPMRLDDPRGIG